MKRFHWLPIVLAVLLLPWLGPMPCRAQPPGPNARQRCLASGLRVPCTATMPSRPFRRRGQRLPPAPRRGATTQAAISSSRPSQKSPLELPPPAGGEVVGPEAAAVGTRRPASCPSTLPPPCGWPTPGRSSWPLPRPVPGWPRRNSRRPRFSGFRRSTSASITSATTATARI